MAIDYKYKIRLDIQKDAWNWFNGCNSVGYGVDWRKRVSEDIYSKIHGKSRKEAYDFIMPFLKKKYVDDKKEINNARNDRKKEFDQKFQEACEKLAKVMGKPIYRDDFTFYLTTFPRGPYNYYKGTIWEYIGWPDPIGGFLHELCHFQFIHYWQKNPNSPVSKLETGQFENFKESLTMILDEDFYPLMNKPDQGYDMHQEFRKELSEFWKTNKNFDELVEFGLKKLPEFVK